MISLRRGSRSREEDIEEAARSRPSVLLPTDGAHDTRELAALQSNGVPAVPDTTEDILRGIGAIEDWCAYVRRAVRRG